MIHTKMHHRKQCPPKPAPKRVANTVGVVVWECPSCKATASTPNPA